jgi:hypothetical protein
MFIRNKALITLTAAIAVAGPAALVAAAPAGTGIQVPASDKICLGSSMVVLIPSLVPWGNLIRWQGKCTTDGRYWRVIATFEHGSVEYKAFECPKDTLLVLGFIIDMSILLKHAAF